jgi:hypothetical protein
MKNRPHQSILKLALLLSFFLPFMGQAQSVRDITFSQSRSQYIDADQSVYYTTFPYARNSAENYLFRMDPFFGEVKERWSLGAEPSMLMASTDQSVLFMLAEQPRKLKRLNVATKTIDQEHEVILEDSIRWDIRGMYVLPNDNEQVLMLIATYPPVVNQELQLSIVKQGKIQNTLKIPPNEELSMILGFSNDTTLWTFARNGVISCYKLRKAGLVLEQKFEGFEDALEGRYVPIGDYLLSSQGQYIRVSGDEPVIEGRLNFRANAGLSIPKNSQYFYALDQLSSNNVLLRRYRKDNLEESGMPLKIPDEIFYGNSQLFSAYRDDLFAFGGRQIWWNCESQAKTPVIDGPANLTLCNSIDTTYTLRTQQKAAQYQWFYFGSPILNQNQAVYKIPKDDIGGEHSLRVSDSLGCLSAMSSIVKIWHRPPPPKLDIADSQRKGSPLSLCQKEKVTLQIPPSWEYVAQWSNGDSTFAVGTDTSSQWQVRIRHSELKDCWSEWSDTFKVQIGLGVIPEKPILVSSSPSGFPFCVDTAKIVGPQGYDYYRWSGIGNSNTYFTAIPLAGFKNSSFNLALQVSKDGNCWSPWSEAFQVRSFTPEKPILTRSSNVLISNYADPDVVHEWLLNSQVIPNVTGRFFTATRPGFYSVRVRLGSCTSPDSDFLRFFGTTTSNQDVNIGEIKPSVFPNPVVDELQIKDLDEHGPIAIIDVQGRKVAQYPGSSATRQRINVQHLLKGLYFLQTSSKGNAWNLRFVKE